MHKAEASFLVCAALLLLALPLPRPAAAAWPTDPLVNVPLCTIAGGQFTPRIVPDGAGGAIVTWYDQRGGTADIYAQRVLAGGTVQWLANGVALCSAAGDQASPAATSDGVGGAIATWGDYRSGTNNDIYAQRVSAAGIPLWTTNGVAICTAIRGQIAPAIASDDTNGAIVTWSDERAAVGEFHIYAQRIPATGTVQWPANGVALCTATGGQSQPTIASDGAHGAIVTWVDYRGGTADIYAQRISADGAPQWTNNGVAICAAAGSQYTPTIIPDGAGGAIVSWYDGRSGNNDIYAQRISAIGTVQWAADGVALCTATGSQLQPAIISDGGSGAIVTWRDERSGNADIYSQRISADGTVQWTADGVALCTATGIQTTTATISDGGSGAIVAWNDGRSGTYHIYAQRVSSGGTVQWVADGVAVCTATGNQYAPTIVSDGGSGAIVTWYDNRNIASGYDIYAQQVQPNGQLGGDLVSVPPDAPLAFALDPVRPNPSRGGALTVRFALPSGTAASLELLDVAGRRITTREVGPLGAGRHALELGQDTRLAPGLYLVRLRQGANVRVTRVAVLK